ncbi:hypothetical protein ES703_103591 [subsurface metagenome]
MKIEKAIEIETIHNDHNPNYTDKEREEAHQLSVEALKRCQTYRIGTAPEAWILLPGETDE